MRWNDLAVVTFFLLVGGVVILFLVGLFHSGRTRRLAIFGVLIVVLFILLILAGFFLRRILFPFPVL